MYAIKFRNKIVAKVRDKKAAEERLYDVAADLASKFAGDSSFGGMANSFSTVLSQLKIVRVTKKQLRYL